MNEWQGATNAEKLLPPDRLTIEGEAFDRSRSIHKNDMLAVSRCGWGGAVAEAARESKVVLRRDVALPDDFACLGIAAPGNDVFANGGVGFERRVGGEEDFVSENSWRVLTGLGKRDLPVDVLVERDAPFDGHLVRNAQVAVRAGTLRPVAGHGEAGAGENSQESGNQLHKWGR